MSGTRAVESCRTRHPVFYLGENRVRSKASKLDWFRAFRRTMRP